MSAALLAAFCILVIQRELEMRNIMTKAKVTALTVAAALAFAGGTASAATVMNGSFEEDAGTGVNGNNFVSMPGASGINSWDIFNPVPGWDITGSNGLELQTKNTIPLTPFDGDYYAELDGTENTSIAQDITLNEGSYKLSFAFSPRSDSITTNMVSYGISTLFANTINGPMVGVPKGVWTVVSQNFVVSTAGIYSLFFDGASQSDSIGGFVDGIEINVEPVPLPAAGFLLIGALGGLAAMRRRKKAV